MDNETIRVVCVTILAIAALGAVVRGTLLTSRGEKKAGSRFVLLGAALLMLTTIVIILRNGT